MGTSVFDNIELRGDMSRLSSVVSDLVVTNNAQDKDILLKINDGGTLRTALQVIGAEGSVSMPRQSYVFAFNSSAQTFTKSTYVDVVYSNSDFDTLGELVKATGVFTALTAGRYLVLFYTEIASLVAVKYVETRISVANATNNMWGCLTVCSTGASSTLVLTFSVVYLAAGANLRIKLYHNDTVDRASVIYRNVLGIVKIC